MPYEISADGLSNPSRTVGQVVHHLARLEEAARFVAGFQDQGQLRELSRAGTDL